MSNMWQDVRFGFRMMARFPGGTCLAALILAIGIGANTAIFSAIHAVMFSPLPFPHPERIMTVWSWNPELPFPYYSVSAPDYLDWEDRNTVFDELTVMEPRWLTMIGVGDPQAITGWAVPPNFFAVFEKPPIHGRSFAPEESTAGSHRVAVLGHSLWVSHFGADPGVLGRTIVLDDDAHTIVGIADPAANYRRGFGGQIYVPFITDPVPASRGERGLQVVGRLKPGVTRVRALGEMRAIAEALQLEHVETNKNVSVKIIPLHDLLFEKAQGTLVVVLGAVAFVLLLACVNAAGLLLARSAARGREIAIRSALGAGRLRLIRQMLTESAMLSALAGGLGLLLAIWGLDLVRFIVAEIQGSGGIAGHAEVELNRTVLSFCLVLSVLTGLLSGIVPALQSSRMSLSEALKAQGSGISRGASRHRVLSNLLIWETALALVLLVGAGLLVRSFVRLQETSPGFDTTHLVGLEMMRPPVPENEPNEARASFSHAVLERIGSLPGVLSAASISFHPMSGNNWNNGFTIEGRPPMPPGEGITAEYRNVSPGFLSTMRIPVLAGRPFSARDDGSYLVAVVNEEFARRYFPGQSPIGERIVLMDRSLEIVGVVGNAKYRSMLGEEDQPFIYEPIDQLCHYNMTLLVRSAGEPGTLIDAIRAEIWSVDPRQSILGVHMMKDLVAETASPLRLSAALMSSVALVALLLAVAGIYGVTSFIVSLRRHEIGIRMALGAQVPQIFRLILGRGMILAAIGTAIGLAASLALSRFLASLLYGVSATDVTSYAAGALLLFVTAAAACYLPARRAARIDPLVTLRDE